MKLSDSEIVKEVSDARELLEQLSKKLSLLRKNNCDFWFKGMPNGDLHFGNVIDVRLVVKKETVIHY